MTMTDLILSGAFLISCLYTLDYLYSSYRFRRFAAAHGCEPCPLQTRSIFHKFRLVTQKYGNIFEDYYASKFKDFGITHSINDYLGQPKVIHTIDPVNLKAVLVESHSDWLVFSGRRNALKPLAQDGVLTTDGALWHHNRKFLHRRINNKHAKDTTSAEHDVAKFFQAIDANKNNINISTHIQRMTLDMSSRYLFGVSADFQPNAMVENKAAESSSEWQSIMKSYVDNWNVLRDYITYRSALGSKYWIIDGFKYRRACARFRKFADMFIERAKQQASVSELEKGERQEKSLISDLISVLQDPVRVREFVLELVIAGQNMTGTSIEWAIAELAEHPDVYTRLREEIVAAFGREGRVIKTMSWDNLQSCQTLQNVIKETLRLHPVVATMSRTAARDTILPRGGGADGSAPVAVPQGATLTSNVYLLHRREEDWGTDANKWIPDRWTGRKLGVEYVPFSAGPRVCLGRQLSLTEISYVIARFVQRYEMIEAVEGARNLDYQYRSILSPKRGVWVILKENV